MSASRFVSVPLCLIASAMYLGSQPKHVVLLRVHDEAVHRDGVVQFGSHSQLVADAEVLHRLDAMLVCVAKPVQRHLRVKSASRVGSILGNVSKLSVWVRPPETNSSGTSSHSFTSRPSSCRCAARSLRLLFITRLRKVGNSSVARYRRSRCGNSGNCSKTGHLLSVPRSLEICELKLLSVCSAANEASHGKPSPAWCVLPGEIQCCHRALRSSVCLVVVTTWTANSFAKSDMNSGGTLPNRCPNLDLRQVLDSCKRPACAVGLPSTQQLCQRQG